MRHLTEKNQQQYIEHAIFLRIRLHASIERERHVVLVEFAVMAKIEGRTCDNIVFIIYITIL